MGSLAAFSSAEENPGEKEIEMIITLDGMPGSGNTTATEKVAAELNFEIITTGEIFKQFAKDNGVAPGELSKFWDTELGKSPETHYKLDQMQVDNAKKGKEQGKNIIFNGKLAAFHLKDLADLKIFLIAPLDVRAQRNSGRDNVPLEQTKQELQKRMNQETENWGKIYGFNYVKDIEYYDYILNTGKLDKEQVKNVLINIINTYKEMK